MRIGIGFDIHPFVRGRKLVLGGASIPFRMGLEGHSDGDCLVHSVCDSLLGACALGDMGRHFPGLPEYRNISSLFFLKKVSALLRKKRFRINNVDVTVIAEAPRISPFSGAIRKNISGILGISISRVSVKSTTAKKTGFLGSGKAIACIAAASVTQKK